MISLPGALNVFAAGCEHALYPLFFSRVVTGKSVTVTATNQTIMSFSLGEAR